MNYHPKGSQLYDLKFPPTQYHGSKARLVDWILENTPPCDSILDAFSGSGVVSYAFKQRGKRVIANDLLASSYHFANAVIENNRATLNKNEIESLLAPAPQKHSHVEEKFADVFFTEEECRFLDSLYANILLLPNEYKRSIAFAAAVRTCIQKMPGGKFRGNLLAYRNKNHRYYRPKFSKDIRETFLFFLSAYNNAVFDNGRENIAHNSDILDVIGKVEVDLAYFDPPYGGSTYDYMRDYFFVELYTRYYEFIPQGKESLQANSRIHFNSFSQVSKVVSSLRKLFENATHIKYWLVSYNDRSLPTLEELVKLIHRYKKRVAATSKAYAYKSGKNHQVSEYLFLCW